MALVDKAERKPVVSTSDFVKQVTTLRESGVAPKHEIALTPNGEEVMEICWTQRPQIILDESAGTSVIDMTNSRHGREVLLIGEPGCGKSMIIRLLANRLKKEVLKSSKFVSINASPGMRVDQLVGFPRLEESESKSALGRVVFQDGLLTQAIKNGWAFGFEEVTRAPQEMLSRLYNLMDGGFAGWTVYENGEQSVRPHPGFWLLATANPTGAGLYTAPMDRALERRFKIKIEAENKWVDEHKVLTGLLWGDEDVASRFLTFAEEVRKSSATLRLMMNTGTLIETVKNITLGLSIGDAIKYTAETRLAQDDKENRKTLNKHVHFYFDVNWKG